MYKFLFSLEKSVTTRVGKLPSSPVLTAHQRQESTSFCRRQYLSGEALKVIDSLGHSATAYEAAKESLERKFGGKRRQIALYLEELEQFRQIRPGNAIEEFADLLDIAMINLQEAGHHYELGDGSLYNKLQRKIPETMLARYHRWIFENNGEESVIALRNWVLQEAEFQTIASETVHGLTGKLSDVPTRSKARYGNHSSVIQMKVKSPKNRIFRNVESNMAYGVVVTLFVKVCKSVGA